MEIPNQCTHQDILRNKALFAPGEVLEIWITFADPQIGRERHRLTSPRFLERFRNILRGDGSIKLKTDSKYLYHYTLELLKINSLPVHVLCEDVYAQPPVVFRGVKENCIQQPVYFAVNASEHSAAGGYYIMDTAGPEVAECGKLDDIITSVQTFYEKHYIKNGLKIHYMEFSLGENRPHIESPQWNESYWEAIEMQGRAGVLNNKGCL